MAQEVPSQDYYVVIGAFSELPEAIKLTEEANLKSFNAHYAFYESKKKYYVYLLHTTELKKAKSFLKQIRKKTEYKNANLVKGKWEGI
jgi:hypothetical protein